LNLTPEEEEAIWSVVDYNTMSNQLGEDVIMNGHTSDGTILDSWVDLFGPIDYALLSSINTTNQDQTLTGNGDRS
jgi:hypothetical protein